MQVENPPAFNISLSRDQLESRPHQCDSAAESVFVADAHPEEPRGIHDNVAKYTKALGIVHIVCGLVHMLTPALLSNAIPPLDEVVASVGVLPSVFFLLSGSFAIQGARKRSRCLVSASSTLSVFSTIAAGLLLIQSWCMLGLYGESSFERSWKVFVIAHPVVPSIMSLLVGVTMLIVATISAALPCAIQDPQGKVSEVPASSSSTFCLAGIRTNRLTFALSVGHLLWALLLILADVVSDRHVGVKRKMEEEEWGTSWQGVTGFTLPPGLLASVGLFLLASSLLAMLSMKKSSKVLHLSAIVPSVFAAVSAGVALYVCSVSAANQNHSEYRRVVDLWLQQDHGRTFNLREPFPVGLAIFGSLVLLITTSASSLLHTNKLGKEDSSRRNTLTENSNTNNYTQFLDSRI